MAFLKKLKTLFRKLFSSSHHRRKKFPRKVKKRIIKKFSSKRPVRIKRSSKKLLPEKTAGLLIGEITHFFPRIQVCVLKVTASNIKVGDSILISGKERRFTQKVASLQIESVNVQTARRGDLAGLKLDKPAKVGNKIFKVTP